MDAADRIPGLYERHALAWDGLRSAGIGAEQRWLERLVMVLPGGAKGSCVLDLGCGTGEPVGKWLRERGVGVTGVDASAAMIDLARARLPEAEWVVGDMTEADLGRTFDGVIAWNSLFHLTPTRQRAAIGAIGRHVRAGGVCLFTSGPGAGEAIGEFQGEALYHASLDGAEYRSLLRAQGFEVIAGGEHDTALGTWVWLARKPDTWGTSAS